MKVLTLIELAIYAVNKYLYKHSNTMADCNLLRQKSNQVLSRPYRRVTTRDPLERTTRV